MSDTAAQTPRPFCLGRYLIDLPPGVDAVLPSASAEYRFGTITTERVQMTPKQFAERMEKREAAIKGKIDTDNFAFKEVRSPSTDTKIFISEADVFGSRLYNFEAYRLTGGVLFSIQRGPYNDKNIGPVLTELQTRLLPSLRARAPDEVPTEPGLCIADGFIASDGSEKALEDARIRLDSKRWPDVYFSVDTSTVHKAEPFLLERRSKAEVPAEIAGLLGKR